MKLKLYQPLKNASNWVFDNKISEVEERIMFTEMDKEPIMWVSNARSLVKAISWRIWGTIDTFVISYVILGKAKLALAISGIEILTKILGYYVHERVWNKIKWGRE
jgi:uncharacterized membrane protein